MKFILPPLGPWDPTGSGPRAPPCHTRWPTLTSLHGLTGFPAAAPHALTTGPLHLPSTGPPLPAGCSQMSALCGAFRDVGEGRPPSLCPLTLPPDCGPIGQRLPAVTRFSAPPLAPGHRRAHGRGSGQTHEPEGTLPRTFSSGDTSPSVGTSAGPPCPPPTSSKASPSLIPQPLSAQPGLTRTGPSPSHGDAPGTESTWPSGGKGRPGAWL